MNNEKELPDGVTLYPIPGNFTYPENIPKPTYRFGSLALKVLRSDGDWRPYVPEGEEQSKYGVEPSDCYIEAQQHTLATLQEEEYGLPDQDYSGRFNANFTHGSPQGGDPLLAAQSFRDQGLIPDSLLPFTPEIQSWADFVSFKGGDKDACLAAGRAWRKIWDPRYEVIWEKGDSLADKYARLRAHLKNGPVDASAYGWARDNTTGLYVKPAGATDQHLIEIVYLDEENCAYIWDSYKPFLKKLAPFYNFDFGLGWTLERQSEEEKKMTWLAQQIISLYKQVIALFITQKKMPPNTEEEYRTLHPEPVPPVSPITTTAPDMLTRFCLAIQDFEDYVLPGGKYKNGNVATNGSPSWRNRNPGNLKWTPYTSSLGKCGKSFSNFCVFITYEVGFEALKQFVRDAAENKLKDYHDASILSFFSHYTAEDYAGARQAYANSVAQKLGVGLDYQINNLIK